MQKCQVFNILAQSYNSLRFSNKKRTNKYFLPLFYIQSNKLNTLKDQILTKMFKCTDARFTQTSPTTFFRKDKTRQKQSQEQPQMTDQEVTQKLHLILISFRQEALKAARVHESQEMELQTQIHDQNAAIQQLVEENRILRQHVAVYIEKYGRIKLQLLDNSSISTQLTSLNVLSNKKEDFLSVQNLSQKKGSSGMSTNYASNVKPENNQFREKSDSRHENFKQLQNESLFLAACTNSSFFKKKKPYQPEQTLQKYKQPQITLSYENTNAQVSGQCQASSIQSKDDSLIDMLDDQCIDQQAQMLNLGLQSKGSSFFNAKDIAKIKSQNLLQTDRSSDFQVQSSLGPNQFQSLKTDSDIRRMGQALEAKFMNKKVQVDLQNKKITNKNSQKIPILQHHKKQNLEQLKYLKCASCTRKFRKSDEMRKQNNSDVYQVKSKENSDVKQYDSKLKRLFSPFQHNSPCKITYIHLQNGNKRNYYARQSKNVQKLSELFMQNQNRKKYEKEETSNPFGRSGKRNNMHKIL